MIENTFDHKGQQDDDISDKTQRYRYGNKQCYQVWVSPTVSSTGQKPGGESCKPTTNMQVLLVSVEIWSRE